MITQIYHPTSYRSLLSKTTAKGGSNSKCIAKQTKFIANSCFKVQVNHK